MTYSNTTTYYLTLEIDVSTSLSILPMLNQQGASASLSDRSKPYPQGASTSLSILPMLNQQGASTSLSDRSKPYPQGASTSLSIQSMLYQLYDIQGKVLQNQKITGYRRSIDMSNLVPATYFVKVIEENKAVKTFKIIKN